MWKRILILFFILILNINLALAELTFIRIEHTVKFEFRAYPEDTLMTANFYIDDTKQQVYYENKEPVECVKKFDDNEISFMTIQENEKYKIHKCYEINRYTGVVTFYLYEYPLTPSARFYSHYQNRDGFVASGRGTATKQDISKRLF